METSPIKRLFLYFDKASVAFPKMQLSFRTKIKRLRKISLFVLKLELPFVGASGSKIVLEEKSSRSERKSRRKSKTPRAHFDFLLPLVISPSKFSLIFVIDLFKVDICLCLLLF